MKHMTSIWVQVPPYHEGNALWASRESFDHSVALHGECLRVDKSTRSATAS